MWISTSEHDHPICSRDPQGQSSSHQARALGFDCIGVTDPDAIAEAGRHFREFLEASAHGDMDWLAANPERRTDPRVLWPGVRSVIMLGVNYGPDENPLAILAAAHARRDLGLCAGRRLSRPDQEAAEGAGAMAGRGVRLRGQGVRRHRSGHGKAAWRRRQGSAGRASTPISSRANSAHGCFSARSSRHWTCRAMRPRPIIAARAGPASTSVRHPRFRHLTSSMRGAAFPISPSKTRGRSRRSFAKPSATASMAATTASRSARGTNSRKPAVKQSSPRATNCARRNLPISQGSTTRRSARCLQNRRSSASAATASSAMC